MESLRHIVCAALIACALALEVPAAGWAPGGFPLSRSVARVEVRPGNNMPIVDCEIDGVPCRLLLDTGATHTTLDETFVKTRLPGKQLSKVMLGGVTNVTLVPSLTHADVFKVGNALFSDLDVMVLDLSHLSIPVGERLDGILGMNIIGATRTIISFSKGEVLMGLDASYREGFEPVRRVKLYDPFTITLNTAGGTEVIVDSGSTFTLLPNSANWPTQESESAAIGAADVNQHLTIGAKRGKPGELDLGGVKVPVRPLVLENPAEKQGRIGADSLFGFDMLIERMSIGIRNKTEASCEATETK